MKETDILSMPSESSDDIINSFIPSGNIYQLKEVENMVAQLLNSIPKINRQEWRKEMENMVIDIKENPTTFDINQGLSKSQGYKDRLSEMLLYAQREFRIRKRCMDMLYDAVNLISKASSADKRRGEATMRYPTMILQVEASEIFIKEIECIYANVKSSADAISRQASVMSMQIQLGERRQGNTHAVDIIPQSNAEEITPRNNKEKLSQAWDEF